MKTSQKILLASSFIFLNGALSAQILDRKFRSPSNSFNTEQNAESISTDKDVPSSIAIEPCSGSPYNSSNPFRPGMFTFEGDFEQFSSSSHGSGSYVCVTTDFTNTHAIHSLQDNNCFSSIWKVSHGTPEVCAEQNNHFIHLWSGDWGGDGDREGEGIFYDCAFDFCGYYEISLRVRSSGLIKKVKFYLAEGLQHKAKDGNEELPESNFFKKPTPSTTQLIHEIDNFNSSGWTNITLPVFKPTAYNMRLWIYTEDDNNIPVQGVDLFYIDDVTDGIPGSSGTCSGNITYTFGSMPTLTKANFITAKTLAQVNSGSSVEFKAGTSISLQPGFRASNGSFFRAHIAPCTTSNYCPTSPPALLTSQESLDLKLYPNPSESTIYIEKPLETIHYLSVVETHSGVEVISNNYVDAEDKLTVDISHLQPGEYIVVLITEKGKHGRRFIKK